MTPSIFELCFSECHQMDGGLLLKVEFYSSNFVPVFILLTFRWPKISPFVVFSRLNAPLLIWLSWKHWMIGFWAVEALVWIFNELLWRFWFPSKTLAETSFLASELLRSVVVDEVVLLAKRLSVTFFLAPAWQPLRVGRNCAIPSWLREICVIERCLCKLWANCL